MDNKLTRAFINTHHDFAGGKNTPQAIVVRQVIGERETQKVLDIHVRVPERKPAVEQIIDVFVKNLKVMHIDVITDRIVVRGELEVKAIYVAATPEQPVHAVELKHYKFSQEVEIFGARRGMDAEAVVSVEFVDYDVAEFTRAYKYKNYEHINCFDTCDDDDDDYEDDDDCGCGMEKEEDECSGAADPCEEKPACGKPSCSCSTELATRDFDVSIVLGIAAKVLADREVVLGASVQPAPYVPPVKPKTQPQTKPAAKKPAPKPQLPVKPKG
jgi:hypothetical protein